MHHYSQMKRQHTLLLLVLFLSLFLTLLNVARITRSHGCLLFFVLVFLLLSFLLLPLLFLPLCYLCPQLISGLQEGPLSQGEFVLALLEQTWKADADMGKQT